MSVHVRCGACGTQGHVSRPRPGKKVNCPSCGAVLTLPAGGEETRSGRILLTQMLDSMRSSIRWLRTPEPPVPDSDARRAAPTMKLGNPEALPSVIQENCPSCGYANITPEHLAGRTVTCLACGTPVPIPKTGATPTPLPARPRRRSLVDSISLHLQGLQWEQHRVLPCPHCGHRGPVPISHAHAKRTRCLVCGAVFEIPQGFPQDSLTAGLLDHRLKPPSADAPHVEERRRMRVRERRLIRITLGLGLIIVGLWMRSQEHKQFRLAQARMILVPPEILTLLSEQATTQLTPEGLTVLLAAMNQTRADAPVVRVLPQSDPARVSAIDQVRQLLSVVPQGELAWFTRVVNTLRQSDDGPGAGETADASMGRRVPDRLARWVWWLGGGPAYAQTEEPTLDEQTIEAALADLLISLSDEELRTIEAVVEEALAIITGAPTTLTEEEQTLMQRMVNEARAMGAQADVFYLAAQYDLPLPIVSGAVSRVALTGVPGRDLDEFARAALLLGQDVAGRDLRSGGVEGAAVLRRIIDAMARAKSLWLSVTYWEHADQLRTTGHAVAERCGVPLTAGITAASDTILQQAAGAPLTDSPEDIKASPTRSTELQQSASWYTRMAGQADCPAP